MDTAMDELEKIVLGSNILVTDPFLDAEIRLILESLQISSQSTLKELLSSFSNIDIETYLQAYQVDKTKCTPSVSSDSTIALTQFIYKTLLMQQVKRSQSPLNPYEQEEIEHFLAGKYGGIKPFYLYKSLAAPPLEINLNDLSSFPRFMQENGVTYEHLRNHTVGKHDFVAWLTGFYANMFANQQGAFQTPRDFARTLLFYKLVKPKIDQLFQGNLNRLLSIGKIDDDINQERYKHFDLYSTDNDATIGFNWETNLFLLLDREFSRKYNVWNSSGRYNFLNTWKGYHASNQQINDLKENLRRLKGNLKRVVNNPLEHLVPGNQYLFFLIGGPDVGKSAICDLLIPTLENHLGIVALDGDKYKVSTRPQRPGKDDKIFCSEDDFEAALNGNNSQLGDIILPYSHDNWRCGFKKELGDDIESGQSAVLISDIKTYFDTFLPYFEQMAVHKIPILVHSTVDQMTERDTRRSGTNNQKCNEVHEQIIDSIQIRYVRKHSHRFVHVLYNPDVDIKSPDFAILLKDHLSTLVRRIIQDAEFQTKFESENPNLQIHTPEYNEAYHSAYCQNIISKVFGDAAGIDTKARNLNFCFDDSVLEKYCNRHTSYSVSKIKDELAGLKVRGRTNWYGSLSFFIQEPHQNEGDGNNHLDLGELLEIALGTPQYKPTDIDKENYATHSNRGLVNISGGICTPIATFSSYDPCVLPERASHPVCVNFEYVDKKGKGKLDFNIMSYERIKSALMQFQRNTWRDTE